MNHVRAFVAGFLSTLIFHQGLIFLFYLLGAFPHAPWSLQPMPPFGVPAVISLAFWGGVWGIAIAWLIRNATGTAYWVRAIVFGAIGPSAVALFVIFPMKGMGMAGGWDPKIIIGALLVNGVWGLGLALLLRWLKRAGL
jgi:hypothetical protein